MDNEQIREAIEGNFVNDVSGEETAKLRSKIIKKRNHAAKHTSRKFLAHKATMRRQSISRALELTAKFA